MSHQASSSNKEAELSESGQSHIGSESVRMSRQVLCENNICKLVPMDTSKDQVQTGATLGRDPVPFQIPLNRATSAGTRKKKSSRKPKKQAGGGKGRGRPKIKQIGGGKKKGRREENESQSPRRSRPVKSQQLVTPHEKRKK